MKKHLKLLKNICFAGLLGVFVTSSASAEINEINVALYGPPGGGYDSATAGFLSAIEDNGISVRKNFFGSCIEALTYVSRTPNSLMVGGNSTVDPLGVVSNWCPNPGDFNVSLAATLITSPLYLCTAPSSTELTADDLLNGNRFNIGVVSTASALGLVNLFIAEVNENLRAIPYEGASTLSLGAITGDIDFFYNGNIAPDLVDKGATCLAASSSINWFDVPSIGELFDLEDFPQVQSVTAVWTAHHSDAMTEILTNASMSQVFLDYISNRKVTHVGFGTGLDLEQQQDFFLESQNALRAVTGN